MKRETKEGEREEGREEGSHGHQRRQMIVSTDPGSH